MKVRIININDLDIIDINANVSATVRYGAKLLTQGEREEIAEKDHSENLG